MKWQFLQQALSDVTYGITQRDDFSNEDVSLEETIVRESVQNSLDAHMDSDKPVIINYRWLSASNGLDKDYLESLVAEQLPHAQIVGIDTNVVSAADVSALVIEDFNTTGLTGAVDKPDDGDFTSFFRNHGRSRKQGSKRGRWGLGKLVYSQTSQIGVVFGLTIRSGDPTAHLMGQTVLDVREHNGGTYPPHALFSDMSSAEDPLKRIQIPVQDEGFVATFREKFQLEREGEPGLSLVVPYPDTSFDAAKMIGYSIRSYFYPLITGHLELNFNGQLVNDTNVRQLAKRYASDAFKGIDPLFDFIEGIFHFETSDLISLKGTWANDTKLDENDFEQSDLEKIQDLFASGAIVGLKLPLTLTRKDGTKCETFFKVFIQRPNDLEFGHDLYVRGGLTVPKEQKFGHRKALGAMIAEDEEICAFLGDGENAAHTKWAITAQKLKNNWRAPQDKMRVIRQSVVDLYDMLADDVEEKDTTGLSIFFPDPTAETNKKKKKKVPVQPPVTPPQTEKPLRVSATTGGFKVQGPADTDGFTRPYTLSIALAYEVLRGNPFAKYKSQDFDVNGKGNVAIEVSGDCELEELAENRVKVTVTGGEFTVAGSGFDLNRDLKVKTRRGGLSDAQDL